MKRPSLQTASSWLTSSAKSKAVMPTPQLKLRPCCIGIRLLKHSKNIPGKRYTIVAYGLRLCSLANYCWPTISRPLDSETGERVTPSDWDTFRQTHKFKAPSCLCAFVDKRKYTESRVGIVEMTTQDIDRNYSTLKGEYVAVCAEQRCGYLRELAAFR
jgi:hypothetical protein